MPIPPAVQAYLDLDLKPQSDAVKSLFDMTPEDAGRTNHSLTAEGHELCAGITPAMAAWLTGYVAPTRQNAIGVVAAMARRITVGRNTEGILAEKEIDAAERHRAQRRNEIYNEYHDRNGELLKAVDIAEDEYDRLRVRENGRDAKVPNPLVEWGVLFPLILIPEALLNFESFRKAPIVASDAMALGITILVGLAIAVAAHLLGSFVKQFNFYMKPDDEKSKGEGLRKLTLGLVLLLAALASVASARYYYLVPMIEQADMIGGERPNMFASVGGSLIGNLVVFLLGAAFTFLLHDSNPLFTEKRVNLIKSRKQLDQIRRREIDQPLSDVDLQLKRRKDEIDVLVRQMEGAEGYAAMREVFSNIAAKDIEAAAALQAYKTRLVARLEEYGNQIVFSKNVLGQERGGDRVQVSVSEFAAAGVRLCY